MCTRFQIFKNNFGLKKMTVFAVKRTPKSTKPAKNFD